MFGLRLVAYLLGDETVLDDLLDALLLGTVVRTALNEAVSMALVEELDLHLRDVLNDAARVDAWVHAEAFRWIACLYSRLRVLVLVYLVGIKDLMSCQRVN